MTQTTKNLLATALVFIVGISNSAASAIGQDRVPNQWIVELEPESSVSWLAQSRTAVEGRNSGAAVMANSGVDPIRAFNIEDLAVRQYVAQIDAERTAILTQAESLLGRSLKPRVVIRHVSHAIVLNLNASEAAKLEKMPGIRSVRPDRIERLALTAGAELTGARALAEGSLGLPSTRGEGTVIGIIDTGVDWNHRAFSDDPADAGGHVYVNPYTTPLGLCDQPGVNCNNKLVGVYDFLDQGDQGFDDSGHGTHVASIAGGNEWATGLGGVAPRAHIISYKTCSSNGCLESARLQAVEQALIDGVDVINYSSVFGSATNPWLGSTSLLELREAGILFVNSAGNNGPDNPNIASPADAPWVIGVGSSTHRERVGHRVELMDGGRWPIIYGEGAGLHTAPIANVPLITGLQAGGSMEGCGSLPPLSMANSVALLVRGGCGFSTKITRAANAGARAVIIMDDTAGFPFTMTDLFGSQIPAGLISLDDGTQLLAALESVAPPARVNMPSQFGTFDFSGLQDRVSVFSTRGPGAFAPGVMKPNLLAPGELILAAEKGSSGGSTRRSGTSFSSPHVAGAIALLRELHPDWTPDQIQSALETTAVTTPLQFAGRTAIARERGNGRLRVDLAARAGLFLPVGRETFLAADPAQGGDPGQLNLAGIRNSSCLTSCTAERTVQAMQSGSWSLNVEGDLALVVEPSSFSLQAGQAQALQIQISPALNPGEERLIDGRVILTPDDPDLAEQALTIAAGFLPAPDILLAPVEIDADANRGRTVFQLPSVRELPEARFRTSPLILPEIESLALAQDPSPDNPFSEGSGVSTLFIDVPEQTLQLLVELEDSSASDIDVYVGRDENSDELPSPDEVQCALNRPGNQEGICALALPQAGRYWIRVQNYQASSPGASDSVDILHALLPDQHDDTSLVVTGPGRHDGGTLDLEIAWDQAAMKRDQRWVGAFGIATTPDETADVGVIPLSIVRSSAAVIEPTALFNDQLTDVVLAPGTTHDRLYIDLPPTSENLAVEVISSNGVEASIHRLDHADGIASAPGTPPAPEVSLANGTGSPQGLDLNIDLSESPEPLRSGRFYIKLANGLATEQTVSVRATISEAGRLDTRFGLWSPLGRTIFQGFEWQRAGPGFLIWYTYDSEGLPTFYIATQDIDPDSSIWTARIDRLTGNNVRHIPVVAGEISLTALDRDRMAFAWRVGGDHGSEIMINNVPDSCPEVGQETLSLTAHWFSPGLPVGGTAALVTATSQDYLRYYFDLDNVGRWVFLLARADSEGVGDNLEVRDFRGFCPGCPSFPMNFDTHSFAVGSAGMIFNGEDQADKVIEFTSAPPLGHHIQQDLSLQKLSERLSCP